VVEWSNIPLCECRRNSLGLNLTGEKNRAHRSILEKHWKGWELEFCSEATLSRNLLYDTRKGHGDEHIPPPSRPSLPLSVSVLSAMLDI